MDLGYMPMPADFRYREIAQKGRPQHICLDAFTMKHPPMPSSRWAKIFSPFDALKGFSEAVASKDVQYVRRRELDEEEETELSRRVAILHSLTRTGRMARANAIRVTVRYYVPCADEESFAYGIAGSYVTVTGTVLQADSTADHCITLQTAEGRQVIDLSDVLEITAASDLFKTGREPEAL